MIRWARGGLSVAVGLLLVVGAIGWMWWAYRIPSDERGEALILPGFALALVGALVGVLPLLTQLGRRAATRQVKDLADQLANAVDGQWRTEAHQRRLLPDPIQLRWSLSDLPLTGSLLAAVGSPGELPAFQPLPGYAQIAESDLRLGGGRSKLHAVYAGLASGRIVVAGAPGSGKSGTAILLLLDALTHRNSLENPQQRAQVPIPILLTAHGWDPTHISVQDWLADQLTLTYPMFDHRDGRTEAITLLTARDQVALLLDGLDEMDASLRPAALQALSDAPFRVVVLTRSEEMVHAASKAWLAGAVAVHLHGITAAKAVDYLTRARTSPPPSGWAQLLTHLREHPKGTLARELSTPLTLTLLRDTYQPSDDVSDLLHFARAGLPGAIEQQLVARVLPAAYALRPGRPAPRYTEQQARQTLSFLARKLGTDRDLAWWHIPRWTPCTPRLLTTGFVSALLLGLGLGLANGIKGALEHGLETGLTHGLNYGLAGFFIGATFGLTFGYISERSGDRPQRLNKNRRTVSFRLTLHSMLIGAIIGWIALVLVGYLVSGLQYGLALGMAVGLPQGIAGGLMFGLLFRNISTENGDRPREPHESWRNDRVFMLSGALIGGILGGFGSAVGAQTVGVLRLEGVLVEGLWTGLAFGLTVGLPAGLMVTLVVSRSWPTTLAWLQLRLSGHVPAVGLIHFLEDARKREVLRAVGTVYQFRHATLQDQLASHDLSKSALPVAGPYVVYTKQR